jgi:hypothetical protein
MSPRTRAMNKQEDIVWFYEGPECIVRNKGLILCQAGFVGQLLGRETKEKRELNFKRLLPSYSFTHLTFVLNAFSCVTSTKINGLMRDRNRFLVYSYFMRRMTLLTSHTSEQIGLLLAQLS